jgi:hypothetical protein
VQDVLLLLEEYKRLAKVFSSEHSALLQRWRGVAGAGSWGGRASSWSGPSRCR